jgi:hypothetical protein
MAIAVAALMDGTTKQTTRQWKYGRRLQCTVVKPFNGGMKKNIKCQLFFRLQNSEGKS